MKPYFEQMQSFGTDLTKGQIKSAGENVELIRAVEQEVQAEIEKIKKVGFPEEKINARGMLTIWQRLQYLVDPGTWCPLHTLYNPADNDEGHTNVFDGLAKIAGKWAVIIGISKYQFSGQSGLTDLVFADDDAKAFAHVL